MMRPSFLLFTLIPLCSLPVAAQTQTAAPAATSPALSAADRDFNALMEVLKNARMPENWDQLSPSQQVSDDNTRLQQLQNLQLGFIDSHPTDPRRWEIVVILRRTTARFVKEILPGYDANPVAENLVIDQPAREARLRRIGELEDAMLRATDVPARLGLDKYRPLFLARKVDDQMTFASGKPAAEIDWNALESQIDAYARDFPAKNEAVWLEVTYLRLLQAKRPDAVPARLQHSAQNPNKEVRQMVEGRLRLETTRHEPLELKFTALDGREVDLAKLRGKVVLLDFWAMWCGPCLDELPNVKAVYEKYHDHGFEVIGIAIESETDRAKLREFIAREELPWPQYFEGRKWKTSLAKDFSISSIPATLLLGPDGRLVSTSARGPFLESEVKRLLSR